MSQILAELVEAGVHFGHQTKRWNPKMKPFILDTRNQIHILNIEETVKQIDTAAEFLADLARKGKRILFVGCKRQAQEAIREAADACGQFYVNHRWLGGTLTNFNTVKRSLGRMKHIEKMDADGSINNYVKQEQSMLRREAGRLSKNFDGIRSMVDKSPAAMFIIDLKREHNAVAEGRRLKIPIVAIVDTNCDPDLVDFPIPGNDDAIRAVGLLTRVVADAVAERPRAHTAPDFVAAYGRALDGMAQIWRAPEGAVPFAVPGSGTIAMETAASNLIDPGDAVVVASTGYFGDRMAEMEDGRITRVLSSPAAIAAAHPIT